MQEDMERCIPHLLSVRMIKEGGRTPLPTLPILTTLFVDDSEKEEGEMDDDSLGSISQFEPVDNSSQSLLGRKVTY